MKLPGLQYTSPVQFTTWQRVQLCVIPPLIAYPLRTLFRLNTIELRNPQHLQNTLSEHGHSLLALFHESTAAIAYAYQGQNFHSTASFSFDGELAARTVSYFGAETVRGSSSRGGSEALREMQKAALIVPCVGITIDGPRGPRRVSKPGIAILSARTQLPVVPIMVALTRRKRLKSWDRMPIPLPGGRVVLDHGEPIAPPSGDSPECIEAKRLEIEQTCLRMQLALELELNDNPQH